MFAYIPDDLLLKGLKLGEFKYKDLEPSIRANKEFIDTALKISVNNLKYVPSSELESLNVDFKKYLADVIASGSFTQISALLKDFGENSKFIDALDKKNVINLLIASYFEDHLLSVLKVLPKSCLIFKDLNFVKEVFQGLEKDKDITMRNIAIIYGALRSQKENAFYKNKSNDLFFEKYSVYLGASSLSNDIRNAPKLFLEFIDYCLNIKKDDFQDKLISFLEISELKLFKEVLNSSEVLAKLIEVKFNVSKNKIVELYVFETFPKKIPTSLILDVMKILIPKGYIFGFGYSENIKLKEIKGFEGFDVILNNSIGLVDNYIFGLFNCKTGKLQASKKDIADARFILENLDFNKMPSEVFKDISNGLLDDDGLCLFLKIDSNEFVQTKKNVEDLVKNLLNIVV